MTGVRLIDVDAYLVDTGLHGGGLLGPAEMARAAGAAARGRSWPPCGGCTDPASFMSP